jgi:hypothetical protein
MTPVNENQIVTVVMDFALFLSMANQPLVVQGLLIVEASLSHS